MHGSDESRTPHGVTHCPPERVRIFLTPAQARIVFDEIKYTLNDWPDAFETADEIARVRDKVDTYARWLDAIEWGKSTVPIAMEERPAWWLGVAAALMREAQSMADTSRRPLLVGEVARSIKWAKCVGVGVAIFEQLAALDVLPSEDEQVCDYLDDVFRAV